MNRSQVGPLRFRQGRELEGALGNGIDPDKVSPGLAQVWIKSASTPVAVAQMLPLGPEEALRRLRGEAEGEVPFKQFLYPPVNMELMFELQADTLLQVGVHQQVKVTQGSYKDKLMAAARDFKWRDDLAVIGLTECLLVPYGLDLKFWVEAGNITSNLDLEACHNYEGVETPSDGIWVIQTQCGEKYRNKKPCWIRENLHLLEQGMTIEERLAAHALFGPRLLARIFSDLPGSVCPNGDVPFLCWCDGRAELYSYTGVLADPFYGSASRGRQ